MASLGLRRHLERKWGVVKCALLVVLVVFSLQQDASWSSGVAWELARTTNSILSSTHHFSDKSRSKALRFILDRRDTYQEEDVLHHWAMRGNGYLYTNHQLVLSAELPKMITTGRQFITIQNVGDATAIRADCHLLSIWVRVNGPEIFAGSARAVPATAKKSCFWEFPFDLQVPGNYTVDAKVLVWNGRAPVKFSKQNDGEKTQCEVFMNSNDTGAIATQYPLHDGLQGFKFYDPVSGCCEICSRLAPYCQYWSTSQAHGGSGCELYFSDDTPESLVPRSLGNDSVYETRRRLGNPVQAHGFPHSHETSYFVGCGWSFWLSLDYPCLSGELDDQVYMETRHFVLPDASLRAAKEKSPGNSLFCSKDDLHNFTSGRWVKEAWPTTCGPMSIDENYTKMFKITKHDGANPNCWHRDDLSQVGNSCIERNCGDLDLRSRWVSSLHEDKSWFGVWRNYDCDYLDFTDAQLQQCVNERRISSMSTKGASISAYLNEYMQLRLQNIILLNSTEEEDTLKVVLDTLSMPHLLWHSDDEEWEKIFHAKPTVLPNEEHFWVSSFYVSSERETFVHLARSKKINMVAKQILDPKGYKMLNAYDLTAAFTYDTATQFDGLHVIGPPMKMIIAKMFHFLCAGHVEGSVL